MAQLSFGAQPCDDLQDVLKFDLPKSGAESPIPKKRLGGVLLYFNIPTSPTIKTKQVSNRSHHLTTNLVGG